MKHMYATILILPLLFITMACDDDCERIVYDDLNAPFPPAGIISISLDNAVELKWIENPEPDLAGYNVYVSSRYDGKYELIGSSRTASFVDRGAANGSTYYYAVTAYDHSGNESELSTDVVYDTPRPEGRNVTLRNRLVDPMLAGYDFSRYSILHYDTDETDLFFEITQDGVPYLVVWDDSDIQDMGYTENLDEITAAPLSGWNPTGDALAVRGHTYVIRTFDNHFAKVRIVDVNSSGVRFDWAYQLVAGNRELAHRQDRSLSKRNRHGSRHEASAR